MVANFLSHIFLFFVLVKGILCMEDGVSYIIGSGKVDCFHRMIKNGTMLDFEMEVG